MGRILLHVKMPALILALLACGCASVTVGSQVKDACPESRDLCCRDSGPLCTDDPLRGCKVCVCGEGPKAPGGVQPRPPLSNQPPPR